MNERKMLVFFYFVVFGSDNVHARHPVKILCKPYYFVQTKKSPRPTQPNNELPALPTQENDLSMRPEQAIFS